MLLADLDTAAARAAARLADSLRRARAEAEAGAGIDELLWGLWSRSGLAELWGAQAEGSGIVADEANRHLDAVVALSTAAKRFAERRPDARPGLFLDGWAATSVQEDSLAPRGRADAVLVGTPSALIGREFDTVVVAGVQDGAWPNPRVRGSLLGVPDLVDLLDGRSSAIADRRREVLHDELRLLASAMAVLAYDFFFVTPHFTFEVADQRHMLTFVTLFAHAGDGRKLMGHIGNTNGRDRRAGQ